MITESDFQLDKSRLTLYHDVFKYKVSVHIPGIQFFRNCKTVEAVNLRLFNYRDKHQSYYYHDIRSIIDDSQLMKRIRNLTRWRESHSDKFNSKIRVSENSIILYVNDIAVINSLLNKIDKNLDAYSELYYVEPLATYEKGTIYQKQPKNKFRIYLKTEKYTTSQRKELYDFLVRNQVKLSPSFDSWLVQTSRSNGSWIIRDYWAWGHYFFDFDQESLITILSLKFDKLIRKVCTIQKR